MIHDGTFIDKGWLAAGPAPGVPDSTRLYVAYNLGLQASADLGATWSDLVTLDFGVAQLPRVGPNGELYIAYWDFEDRVGLQRSFDGGTTVGERNSSEGAAPGGPSRQLTPGLFDRPVFSVPPCERPSDARSRGGTEFIELSAT